MSEIEVYTKLCDEKPNFDGLTYHQKAPWGGWWYAFGVFGFYVCRTSGATGAP